MNGDSQAMSGEHCLDVLRRNSLGRIGVTHHALPAIFPVRYAVVGERILFPAAVGGVLDQVCRGQVVAFEVDEPGSDHEGRTTVLVLGVADHVHDALWLQRFVGSADQDVTHSLIAVSLGTVSGQISDGQLATV